MLIRRTEFPKCMPNSMQGKNAASAVQQNNSLESKLTGAELEERRKGFKFPKDFSFENEAFRNEALSLFGRDSFGKDVVGKTEEKRVLSIYKEKIKDYLVEHCKWPQTTALLGTRFIYGLPKGREHKEIVSPNWKDYELNLTSQMKYLADLGKYALLNVPASLLGNLPERYFDPCVKFTNINKDFFTRSSINYSIFNAAMNGYFVYQMLTNDIAEPDMAQKFYSMMNIGAKFFTYAMAANVGLRMIEWPIRRNRLKKGKHTMAPSTFFPLNPVPWDIGTTLILGFDAAATATYKTIDGLKASGNYIKEQAKTIYNYYIQNNTPA